MSKPPDAPGPLPRDFDPAAVLERDIRVLLDPRFLGPLHDELWGTLGPDEAALSLRQMGVLHGLQDAAHALARLGAPRANAFSLPLVIQVKPRARDGAPGLAFEGDWPEAREASARLEFGLGAHGAACHLSAGYTSGWLSGLFDADLAAVETECAAEGRGACRFVAREHHVWRREAPQLRFVHELPLAAYRSLVRERARRMRDPASDTQMPGIERGAACVHLWGPVMVMPFGGPDEALRALEMMQRDPNAQEVSVLVVDLRDAVIDEAFGALALEQLVGSASAWGAEVVLADPSPLSQRAIDALEHPPLLVAKSLEEAVATAFQVARAQRCRI